MANGSCFPGKRKLCLACLVSVLFIACGASRGGDLDLCLVGQAAGASDGDADRIVQKSDSPENRFRRARDLVEVGDYDTAREIYAVLHMQQPENVDYVFGYAQTLFWSGDSDSALRCLSLARDLAPAYEDLWAFELQVLASRPGRSAGRKADAFRSMAALHFPEAAWLSRPTARVQRKFRWEVGTDREHLDNGSPDWNRSYAYFAGYADDGRHLYLNAAKYDRFNLSDNEITVGASVQFLDRWIVGGSLQLSDGSDFLAESAIDVGVSRTLKDGWVLGLSGRNRQFRVDTVNAFGVNADRYFGKYRVGYAATNSRLGSESTMTHKFDFFVHNTSRSYIGVTAVAGEEAEIIAPGQLLVTSIEAIEIIGRHPVNDYLSVVWRVGTHRQGSLYRRDKIGVSIAGGF